MNVHFVKELLSLGKVRHKVSVNRELQTLEHSKCSQLLSNAAMKLEEREVGAVKVIPVLSARAAVVGDLLALKRGPLGCLQELDAQLGPPAELGDLIPLHHSKAIVM